MPLDRNFFQQDAVSLARSLLGRVLLVRSPEGWVSGRIIETEAYSEEDPACHAYQGRCTPRNRSMFLAGGHLYVYFIYGMYYCVNIVADQAEVGSAVLLRGVQLLEGQDLAHQRRGASISPQQLSNGPAKLVQAFGIQAEWNGLDLLSADCPVLIQGEACAEHLIQATPRIGLSKAKDWPWRFVLLDSPEKLAKK